jgi:fumarate hydratase subunit beta
VLSIIDCRPALHRDAALKLRSGESVEISGVLLTIRDASAKRLTELIQSNRQLPIDLDGALLYAVGPSPAKPGQIVGSAGPTTTARLTDYLPSLFTAGARGIIGKGELNAEITGLFVRHQALYLAAIGGLGALLGKCVVKSDVVAFHDLGTEAVFRFEVKNLPAVVIIDSTGDNFHLRARSPWREASRSVS